MILWRNYSRLVRFPKRWRWKKHKASRRHLEAHERAIILRDMAELGGKASARDLRLRFPDRYHERYLPSALKRMAHERVIRHAGWGRWGSHTYELKSND